MQSNKGKLNNSNGKCIPSTNIRMIADNLKNNSFPPSKNTIKAALQNSKRVSKCKTIKNLLILSLGNFLVFLAYDSLSNLQSTMNCEEGVGMASQATIYSFLTVSSLFLPPFVIKRLGCKLTLITSILCFCPYIAANLYPEWWTMIPAAAVCGSVAGPMLSARGTYLNEISFQYATDRQHSVEVTNAWLFGISNMIHHNTEIWGNLISYYVLTPENGTGYIVSNETMTTCGDSFCNQEFQQSNPNLKPPADEKRYLLIGIYLISVLLAAAVLTLLLDPLERDEGNGFGNANFSLDLFFATLNQLKKGNQLLLLPLIFYMGLVEGFYNSEYSKAYIACAWGVPHVGFVSICFGVASAVADVISGPLVMCFTRVPVFLLAATAHFGLFVTLFLWKPTPNHPLFFFVVAGVYGLGYGIWISQITALHGVLFKNDEEAAFSCFYFSNSLGFLLAYGYSNFLCTHVKICILLALLTVGVIGYLTVEVITSLYRKGQYVVNK